MLFSSYLGDKRMKICNNCNKKVNVVGVPFCSECKCPLNLKTKVVNAKCPLDKWSQKDAVHPT